ncbi:hypothetical protein [Marinifilum caeruleilacunae]|uniref:Secreted protein n=1 Tax=Marinifilum caeruleilacunae TaxID=2499076 RepID=A0ABX1X0E6_9BACT|nr:hypothetical protein [Marinifilum caeruleilacunae]NOU61686.1 hypothetical protein [Marinifilum caeruleilacunae]
MKSLFKDKILRITILLLTVMTISIESKAQILQMDQFLISVANVIPSANNSEDSPEDEITNEKGYLDNGILIFKENLKVCKDIVSGSSSSSSIEESTDSIRSEKCEVCQDSIATKQNTTTITKKKRSKNFRNFPGNIRSRI